MPSELEDPLIIEVSEDGDDTVLVLRGELDPHTAPRLRDKIEQALAAGRVNVVLDLAGLSFIDSSGLRVIISAHKDTAERHGHLVLRSPSPTARRLLDITGLLDHIEISG
jgi:anti-sigma B factor antagonist